MLTLSDLSRFSLTDARGTKWRLVDLVVDLEESDYPPVTHLLLKAGAGQAVIPWDQVKGIEQNIFVIKIAELTDQQPLPPEFLDQQILLKRDILDAMVLDLQNRRATRANDLWLAEEGGRLRLQAADVGTWALIRRLTGGRMSKYSEADVYDWKYVEFLRGDPQAVHRGAGYERRIARLPAGVIAQLSEAVPYLHAAELVTLLPDALAADTLELMSPERQLQVFDELDEEQATRLLCLMAPDLAANLVSNLHGDTAQRCLEKLPPEPQRRIVDLLRYPEYSVGGMMTNDIVQAPEDWTVAEARERLRERIKQPDFVYFIYVVDGEESSRLRGVITLRDLLVADEQRRLSEIMNPYVSALGPLESAVDGAYQVITSHLAALPVITQDGHLLGAVTADAAVAQIAPPGLQIPRVFS